MSENVVWHEHKVFREDREKLFGQKSFLLWFTGLSGSGKSTIASLLQEKLFKMDKLCYILDGDNIRHGLNSDLGFSEDDRKENIRRITEVAKLFIDSGMIVITSFISPYREDREEARKKIGKDFIEVFVKCSLEECEKRDPKGFYKKARAGEINDFTGISQPYESPKNPEIVLETDKFSKEENVEKIISYLKERGLI